MSLPIVERLEDAPLIGDCWIDVTPKYSAHPSMYRFVRNKETLWQMDTIGGWKTTACAEEHYNHSIENWGNMIALGIFAPDPATAIERYHASEACPFGKVSLEYSAVFKEWSFESRSEGRFLVWTADCVAIGDGDQDCTRGRVYFQDSSPIALNALISEVIAYQAAERTGSRDSRVHKAIQEMEAV